MRQLKYHERKLLKKVDFLQWKKEHSLREVQVGAVQLSPQEITKAFLHEVETYIRPQSRETHCDRDQTAVSINDINAKPHCNTLA